MSKALNIAIIGAGLIGNKRADAILEIGEDKLWAVTDIDAEKAKTLANKISAKFYKNWQEVLKDPKIDAVIVATTTNVNVKITEAALKANKHVLAEKPLGSTVKEAEKLYSLSQQHKRNLKVGYNHRHHPAIMKAHQLFTQGKIGELMYIRSVYGHGARPGYDLEWRMQKKYSFGGELFDQGVHIIDLINWFMGGAKKVFAQTRNFYWKKSDLEDNAFCQIHGKNKELADFQVSLTQWRNKFLFEIFGTKGYLLISGLGKSYGVETLTLGTKVGLGQVPLEEVFSYDGPDISWREEWKEFKSAILQKRQPLASSKDNISLNRVLAGLYASAKSSRVIKL